ncbi:VOC family protein [Kosakonia radicincitans]|jgi:catechol 2,3-dioxygenase-like lactoylglutathione lyase family enzyme|uniref:VOC family protein n=1 Tax=Kosakonia radicincitans TaxID=283686 RepID=UPI0005C2D4E0|nr:VOC family protein [Kosakonia radicincitans]KIS45087.1 glyoxalase/Bleomycin resistance /Dioxygenase superfamily protein [Kosakonia radicincitans YD4]
MKRPLLLLSVLLGLSGLTQAAGIKTAGIDHVGISVPDLKQAETFFHDTFGCVPATQIGPFALEKLPSPDGKPLTGSVTIAMIRCGNGANIELFAYQDANGSTQMPAMQDIGASHIAFYTDDIQGGVAFLKSKGIAISGEPMTMTSGDTAGETWVHFRSPWGADMELVSYPNGKAYEKHASVKLWKPGR